MITQKMLQKLYNRWGATNRLVLYPDGSSCIEKKIGEKWESSGIEFDSLKELADYLKSLQS